MRNGSEKLAAISAPSTLDAPGTIAVRTSPKRNGTAATEVIQLLIGGIELIVDSFGFQAPRKRKIRFDPVRGFKRVRFRRAQSKIFSGCFRRDSG